MRKYFIITLILGIVAFNVYFFFSYIFVKPETSHTILMQDDGFVPRTLNVKVGDAVVFKNVGKNAHWPASNIHPTHSIYPEFDPKKEIAPGDTWRFVFEKEGTFRMHDHIFSQLTGEITVKPLLKVGESQGKTSFIQKIITFFTNFLGNEDAPGSARYNDQIKANDGTISDDRDALYSYVKKFGPGKAVTQLFSIDSKAGRDCHDDAHVLGKYAYELNGDKAFGMCSAECHSGCYHGATEAFFKEHGTENLSDNLKIVCGDDLNPFFNHQCIHGIGHGLMAWNDYEIHEALKDCDLLENLKESCYSGVFMENIVGALAIGDESESQTLDQHYTKYLSNDPQYPCTEVSEKYKNACYFYQTSRMTQLFQFDFGKVSKECEKVSFAYQQSCFESMGRDVGGFTYNDPVKAIEECMHVPNGASRVGCLRGAVQNAFWDPSGQDVALKFCKLLKDKNEKDACYLVITDRAKNVLSKKEDKDAFCQKAESEYVSYCNERIQ